MGRAQKPRGDLHREITDRILAALERAGDGEKWRPPWVSMAASGLPRNATTGARYRGVNVLNLWAEAQLRGFGSAGWGTYRQWRSLGAQVKKGERAARVIFYRTLRVREEPENDEGRGIEQIERTIPLLRSSAVFNADQVRGYEDPDREGLAAAPDRGATVAACEAVIAASGAEVRRNAGRAFYDPEADYVGLPADELFRSTAGKYSTAFHELTHWTGHGSRLDRREAMAARFGSAAYAAEELVAELGAAFLCAGLGLEPEPRADHAAYIGQWIGLLEDDKRAVFTAAARASDAVEFIEGRAEDAPARNCERGAP
jgi:antirestriction protein ArdC